jgi:NADPH-dependent ferric siderophore reductase
VSTPTPRPARPQTVLSVVRTEWVTPQLVRVIAGGPEFANLGLTDFTDKYSKLVFVKPELGIAPPYDVPALRETLAQDDWPVVRTYTIRRVDVANEQLAIDFVVHGTEGVAGPWAASAQPGDPVVLAGIGGAYAPADDTDWHVFVGDESALPAISSALEVLPADAAGVAYLEVHDDSDVQLLAVPENVLVNWIVRGDDDRRPETLAEAVLAGVWPDDAKVQVFAHGERESMKAVRSALAARGIPRANFSLSGYWAYGRTEDTFQAEKREPIGKIAD